MKYGQFEYTEPLKGVFHIKDAMGVCMTLLVGSEKALLVDTGYGLHNVKACIEQITKLPLTLLLTHAHHDHALGAMWFDSFLMFPEDAADFDRYTGAYQRRRVLEQAKAREIVPDSEADFMNGIMAKPQILREGDIDLGGLTARVIFCPGHTQGSAMVYVPQHRLLLTGDNWNPCTWVFFPNALPVKRYRENLINAVSKLNIEKVLCPHQSGIYDYSKLEYFISNLTDKNLEGAHSVDLGAEAPIDTRQLDMQDGQYIVFDYNKLRLA